MTVTKADLAQKLTDEIGLNKRESKDFVELFFSELNNALANGEELRFSGLGNFILRDKPGRPGRNPKTGEEKVITARRVVTFKPGQKLRSRVNAYHST